MKLSPKDRDKYLEEFRRTERRIIESRKKHERIFELFCNGKLRNLIPQWHRVETEVDLQVQNHELDGYLLEDGFSIFPKVPIDTILDRMNPDEAEFFREKILFRDNLDFQTSEILDFWLRKEKLIPPTILIRDQTIRMVSTDSDELFPADGKHRLNAAYCLDALEIPILVINKQMNKIRPILGV